LASTHTLLSHHGAPGAAVTSISVALRGERSTALELRYRATGPQVAECLQTAIAGSRGDGLWAHTCCELFVRPGVGTNYREFNFSPRGAWAAYDFDDYRAGMRPAVLASEPRLQLLQEADAWTLAVTLAGNDMLPAASAGALWLGLAAVMHLPDAPLSYWALRHMSPKPDFHHRDAFVIKWP
jgi:hypothetical protein